MSEKKDLLESILERPLLVSSDRDVAICSVSGKGRGLSINGYVKSESNAESLYHVEVTYLPASKQVLFGNCSCESYKYYGDPCKHILKLRNVFVKNEKKLYSSDKGANI